MLASVPLMVTPEIVMGLFCPTALLANVAEVFPVFKETLSLPWMPTRAAEDLCNSAVAAVVRSYSRSTAVIPFTVSVRDVMLADKVGWVSV